MFLKAAQWTSAQTGVYKIHNSPKDIFYWNYEDLSSCCMACYVPITVSSVLSGATLILKLITQINQQCEP